MAIVDIPKSPDDLSPEWLTAALQSGGARNANVASFDYEPIAAGVGFLGKLGRLRLRHAEGGEGLPRTLIVKQPTQDAKSRQLAMMFRFYEREVCFYRDVGSAAGIRVPTMYFGVADPKSGDFVMLMEDLAPARLGDQLAGCNAEDARSAVGALASTVTPAGSSAAARDACLAAGHQRSDQSFRSVCLPAMLGAIRAVRGREHDAGAPAHG